MLGTPRAIVRPSNLPGKKRLRTKHLVTLFYSSIISTAAWADSTHKRRRRQKLDAAIAQAEDELRSPKETSNDSGTRRIHTQTRRQASVASTAAVVENDEDFLLRAMQRASNRTSPTFTLTEDSNFSIFNAEFKKTEKAQRKLDVRRGTSITPHNWNSVAQPKTELGFAIRATKDRHDASIHTDFQSLSCNAGNSAIKVFQSESRPKDNPYPRKTSSGTNFNSVSQILTRVEDIRKRSIERCVTPYEHPESIYYKDISRDIIKSAPWKHHKITMFEYNAALLALRLLLEASKLPGSGIASSESNICPERLQSALQELEVKLQSIKYLPADHVSTMDRLKYPRYEAETLGAQKTHVQDSGLNYILLKIFRQLTDNVISSKQALQFIAHNLLVSRLAPTIISLNILITKLSAIGEHGIVHIIIEMLPQFGLRPSEITVCAIICHYIRAGDRSGFIRYSHMFNSRMKKTQNIMNGPYRLGKVAIPRVQPDKHIYHELIRGNLQFGRIPESLRLLDEMSDTGVSLDLIHCHTIIRICAKRSHLLEKSAGLQRTESWQEQAKGYFTIGLRIWKEIMANRREDGNLKAAIIDASTVSQFLFLCKIHGKSAVFKYYYREALCAGYTMDSLLVLKKVNKDYYRVTQSTHDIQRARRRLERESLVVNTRIRLIVFRLTASLVVLRRRDRTMLQDLLTQLEFDNATHGDGDITEAPNLLKTRYVGEAKLNLSGGTPLFRFNFTQPMYR